MKGLQFSINVPFVDRMNYSDLLVVKCQEQVQISSSQSVSHTLCTVCRTAITTNCIEYSTQILTFPKPQFPQKAHH